MQNATFSCAHLLCSSLEIAIHSAATPNFQVCACRGTAHQVRHPPTANIQVDVWLQLVVYFSLAPEYRLRRNATSRSTPHSRRDQRRGSLVRFRHGEIRRVQFFVFVTQVGGELSVILLQFALGVVSSLLDFPDFSVVHSLDDADAAIARSVSCTSLALRLSEYRIPISTFCLRAEYSPSKLGDVTRKICSIG